MLWLLVLHAVLGIPSLALYVFLLIFLEKKAQLFNGPYYTMLKYGGIVNILTYIISFFLLNLINFPELRSFYMWLATIPWFQYSFWLPHASFHLFSLNVILISVHRLVVLRNPLEGDQKFRPFLRPAHVLIPIASFLLTAYIPFQHPQLVPATWGNDSIAEWYMDGGIDFFLITVFCAAIYAVAIAGLSIASFCLMHNHKNIAKTVKKLLAISLVINTVQIGFAFFLAFKVVAFFAGEWLAILLDYYMLPFNITAACLATPWMHLFFNTTVREQVKKTFGWRQQWGGFKFSSFHVSY